MAPLTLKDPPSSAPGSAGPAERVASSSIAWDLAAANWLANVRALSLTQPALIDAARAAPDDVGEWLFGRDGSLTALDPSGKWWAGCSVPLPAARAMLKKLECNGRVACFLAPTLAAHLRVALETLRPDQAVVSVNPDLRVLRVMLHSTDFSDAIDARRLWFAWGADWQAELSRVFRDNPGLATPSQFIRLPVMPDDEVDKLVTAAQAVFAEQNAARLVALAKLRDGHADLAGAVRRVCVLAPSHFRLWDNAGTTLADAVQSATAETDVRVVRFDADHPLNSSGLALARAAAGCDVVLSADTGRADLPNVAPDSAQWVTWVTTGRVPSVRGAADNDAVLLADGAWRAAAAGAGWPNDRIHVATWPVANASANAASGGPLVVVADTRLPDPPEKMHEFSSHVLLWERIRAEIARDPFAVGDDPVAFVDRAIRACGMSGEHIDRRLFADALVVPAYQQALARLLLRERIPVRLYGAGWDAADEFRAHASGPVRSRRCLRRAVAQAAAVVHVWPGGFAHPIDACGRPVVRPGQSGRSFLERARHALGGGQPGPLGSSAPPVEDVLRSLVPAMRSISAPL